MHLFQLPTEVQGAGVNVREVDSKTSIALSLGLHKKTPEMELK